MPHYIVSVIEDVAQQVTADAQTPADQRFRKVEADSTADAFRIVSRAQILEWYDEGLITETERAEWLAKLDQPCSA